MLLLRFTFANHRSFRDEAELSMVQSRLRTSRPVAEPWADYTNRVAAIYGPNAAGKSAVLDALKYATFVIRNSARWDDHAHLPRAPFELDEVSKDRPSSYCLDFVIDDVRYEYGFAVEASRFSEEWLYSYPAGRKRIIYERSAGVRELTFGRGLKGGGSLLKRVTSDRELILSKGAQLKNRQLKTIHDFLSRHITVTRFSDDDRRSRLGSVMEDLASGTFSTQDLEVMLRVADVGIVGAAVENRETDPEVEKLMRAVLRVQAEEESNPDNAAESDDSPREPTVDEKAINEALARAARSFTFEHLGSDGKSYPLPMNRQSTGTLTWLSIAAPALKAIRMGGVFCVDEIDASLHPQLSQVIVSMFKDRSFNTKCAQIVFTTHDTFFLSPTSQTELAPEEVWFVEKGMDGASELFCLSDFPVRQNQNLSRRYLQGRYGALPAVAPSFLQLIADEGRLGDNDQGQMRVDDDSQSDVAN